VQRLPDAAGEAAYTAQVFPPIVSYFTGWMMLLAYFIVCPWEAVAVGRIAAYILPSLNSLPLYSIAGQPVFLPRLILGVVLTLFLATLNYRGIRLTANFQKIMTSTVLLIFAVLAVISGARGAPANFRPVFHATPFVSILLTLQIVPYFLTGFESVPKYAEEANPEFREKSYMKAIGLALGVGVFFYAVSVAAVAYIAPWQSLLGRSFATAYAFEQGIGGKWPVELILFMAFFGLLQCFNGNFVASTRLLFAYGRRRTIHESFGTVHQVFLTPSVAVIGITVGTLVGLLLGDALVVPVTEVGSMASALGWFAACLSFWIVEKRASMRIITGMGIVVSLLLILMKVLPSFPGHFSRAKWIAFGMWVLLGAILYRRKALQVDQHHD
jgi:amino acid transporter